MNTDQLTLTFTALADPTRRQILARLATGEATVNEIAKPFPISLQAVSKHLKVLERAGLIARGQGPAAAALAHPGRGVQGGRGVPRRLPASSGTRASTGSGSTSVAH